MKDIKGIKNPNYKDGKIAMINRWKEAVKERDNYTCQKCYGKNQTKRKVAAHHIKPKEGFPELMYDISNGITLCDYCHRSLHHKGKIGVFRGKTLSQNHKRKIAESHIGYKHTEESKSKMSKSKKGMIPWNKGIPRTEEEKRKISETTRGRTPWNKGLKLSSIIPANFLKMGI